MYGYILTQDQYDALVAIYPNPGGYKTPDGFWVIPMNDDYDDDLQEAGIYPSYITISTMVPV